MTQPSENVWTCRNCTLINEERLTKCSACEYPKPQVDEPLTPRKLLDKAHSFFTSIPDQVSSAVATVQNLVSSSPESSPPRVSASHSPSPPSPPVEQVLDDWTCSRCTFINNGVASNCSMCGAPQRFKIVYPPVEDTPQSGVSSEVTTDDSNSESMHVICESCGMGYDTAESQHCPVCFFEDEDDSDVLERTRQQNHVGEGSASHIQPTEDSSWTCPTCTFKNSELLKMCEICGSVKKGQTPLQAGVEMWKCQICTRENPVHHAKCQSCDTFRENGVKNGDKGSNERPKLRREHSITTETKRKKDTETAKEQFERISLFCKQNSMQFVDDSFPPAPRSIHGNSPSTTQLAGLVASWRRPNELRQHLENPSTTWKVFRHPISPSDISQGVLGDCWFLSALSVLAEKPQLLESIMITKETNPEGAYQVRLCHDGLWETIVIDDSLPASESGNLVCSKAERKQLWVPLIEKALAKMNGSYEALVSGKCLEGLATLTGAPCESVHLQGNEKNNIIIDKNLIWATLLSSKEAGYLMGASCGGGNMKADKAVYESVGLRPRHSYSVLDVQDICDNRLLKLRNPWGRFSWNGDWSDDSPKWTKDLREALGAHESKGGIFWISLDDMLKYFDSVDICKLQPGTSEFRVQGNFPVSASTPSKVVILTLDRPTQVDLTLYQTWRKNETLTSNPLDLMVVVIRTNGGQVTGEPKVVAFTRRQVKAFVSCGAMLEPGDYIILCCSFNTLNGTPGTPTLGQPYVLALHSSRPVLYSPVMRDHTLIAKSLIALLVQKGKRHQDREGVTFYSLNQGWSGTVLVAENRYPDYYMHVHSDFNGSFNVVSTRGQLNTMDSIPPLHRQIINILSQCVESGYSIYHHTKNRMSPRPDLKDWGPTRSQHFPELTPDTFALHCPVPL